MYVLVGYHDFVACHHKRFAQFLLFLEVVPLHDFISHHFRFLSTISVLVSNGFYSPSFKFVKRQRNKKEVVYRKAMVPSLPTVERMDNERTDGSGVITLPLVLGATGFFLSLCYSAHGASLL